MAVPGLRRLSELEARITELEQLAASMARMLDPTAVQLSREDRDRIVAYAQSARESSPPAEGPAERQSR